MNNWANDQGNATITAAGIILALVATLGLMLYWVRDSIHAHKAQLIADLSAVSAARAHDCAAAEHTAKANGGQVISCSLYGSDAIVHASFLKEEGISKAGPITGNLE